MQHKSLKVGSDALLEEYLHLLTPKNEVRLYIGGAVTQHTLDRIIAHLNFLKEDLDTEAGTSKRSLEGS